jgi:hypothetical protein
MSVEDDERSGLPVTSIMTKMLKKCENSAQLQLTPSRSHTCPHIPENTEFVINSMVILPHPPYSLDLAPCDFVLVPK